MNTLWILLSADMDTDEQAWRTVPTGHERSTPFRWLSSAPCTVKARAVLRGLVSQGPPDGITAQEAARLGKSIGPVFLQSVLWTRAHPLGVSVLLESMEPRLLESTLRQRIHKPFFFCFFFSPDQRLLLKDER